MSITLEQIKQAQRTMNEADIPKAERHIILRYYHHRKKRLRKKYNNALCALGYRGQSWRRFMKDCCHALLEG